MRTTIILIVIALILAIACYLSAQSPIEQFPIKVPAVVSLQNQATYDCVTDQYFPTGLQMQFVAQTNRLYTVFYAEKAETNMNWVQQPCAMFIGEGTNQICIPIDPSIQIRIFTLRAKPIFTIR